MPESAILFELGKLVLGYRRRVVLEVASWTVRRGDFWCVLGPNAAGKTTLIRTLLGELEPVSGNILVDRNLAGPSKIGFVPQQCLLNPTLPTTVREFVGLGLVGLGVSAAERDGRIRSALARVGLEGRERENYFRLSGGQRQRALFARALVRRPAILILDEPTQELDTVAESQMLETVGGLNRDEGVTVIFVTHQIDIAARWASRIAFVRGGRLLSGTRDEMLTPAALAETFGAPAAMFEGLRIQAAESGSVR